MHGDSDQETLRDALAAVGAAMGHDGQGLHALLGSLTAEEHLAVTTVLAGWLAGIFATWAPDSGTTALAALAANLGLG